MEVINLKAIPIAWDQNVYRFSKKEMDQLNKIKYTNHYKSKGVFVSKNLSLLELKPFSSIKKFIIKKAEEYMKNVLEINNEIYITQSWSTINTKGSSHELHQHPNTFLSLVYYVQCKSGSLIFKLDTTSLKECFNFQFNINKYNIYNSQSWELPVRTWDMVFFPGHIHHGSTPNTSPTPRLLIGANFFIKGRLGQKHAVDLIGIKPFKP